MSVLNLEPIAFSNPGFPSKNFKAPAKSFLSSKFPNACISVPNLSLIVFCPPPVLSPVVVVLVLSPVVAVPILLPVVAAPVVLPVVAVPLLLPDPNSACPAASQHFLILAATAGSGNCCKYLFILCSNLFQLSP